jgi:hypothetical protein
MHTHIHMPSSPFTQSQVPGLFGRGDYKTLMQECKSAARAEGMAIDADDELYAWFCRRVQKNLVGSASAHVTPFRGAR